MMFSGRNARIFLKKAYNIGTAVDDRRHGVVTHLAHAVYTESSEPSSKYMCNNYGCVEHALH